ncbi:MAG: STAS domain-containing protein [Alphaproteobacteria bacterium]|nr:STAS domain-containing protein [Alphaproteobacteria bacterium]
MLSTIVQTGSTVSVKMVGAMDALGVAQDRDVVARILAGGPEAVTLDLAGVPFMDASGLGLVAHIVKRCRETGTAFDLSNVKGQPAEFLGKLDLTKSMTSRSRVVPARRFGLFSRFSRPKSDLSIHGIQSGTA